MGQWLKISERRLRTLVGCGAAAGIAATFNAPVAGTLFAVEIILGDFGISQFSPIVISSVMATVVSQRFLGDFPAFDVPAYSLVSPLELIAYAILGLAAAFVAVGFVKSLYGLEDVFDRISIYPPLKTVIGGAIIGLVALGFPEALGVGYETINQALRGDIILDLLIILVVVKIFAVSVTIGSGGSGGIFAPSLFIGAMTGGVVGMVVNSFWPGAVADPGAYALVGMGAVVGASTHAPITAILIIFELTNDYKIILPLMISCIIATILATQLQEGSIYTIKLLRRGLNIHKGYSINVIKDLKVEAIMKKDFATVPVNAPLMQIISRFIEQPANALFVIDENNSLCGVITLDEIRPVMADTQSLQGLLIAKDLMIEHGFPKFSPNDSLARVMKHLGSHTYDVPVLDHGEIVGSIWPENVIARYNEEVFKREMASGLATTVNGHLSMETIPGTTEMRIAELTVPSRFVGKTLAAIDLRKKFGVSVIMVKHKTADQEKLDDTIPSAETVLESGDIVVVMGTELDIDRFERG
jgi:CIC family chloride channel protein